TSRCAWRISALPGSVYRRRAGSDALRSPALRADRSVRAGASRVAVDANGRRESDRRQTGGSAMIANWRPIITVLIVVRAPLTAIRPASAVWDHDHGDAANTGFARIDTGPAGKPSQVVQIGRLAPGASPVIGPNGTLFVGNMKGELLTITPDGTITSTF